MLSKSRGLVARLAAIFHVLFSSLNGDNNDLNGNNYDDSQTGTTIPDDAVKAAIDFILMSCQQTAFCAGHGPLEEEIVKFTSSK